MPTQAQRESVRPGLASHADLCLANNEFAVSAAVGFKEKPSLSRGECLASNFALADEMT